MIDEGQAANILRAHGWTPRFRTISGGRYLYAYRKRGGKVEERYIASVKDLATMTEAEIIAKL